MPLFPAVLAAKVSTKAVKSPSSDNNNLSPPLDTISAILLTCMVVSSVVLCVGFFRWKNYDLLLLHIVAWQNSNDFRASQITGSPHYLSKIFISFWIYLFLPVLEKHTVLIEEYQGWWHQQPI